MKSWLKEYICKGILFNKKRIWLPVEIWENNSEVIFSNTHLLLPRKIFWFGLRVVLDQVITLENKKYNKLFYYKLTPLVLYSYLLRTSLVLYVVWFLFSLSQGSECFKWRTQSVVIAFFHENLWISFFLLISCKIGNLNLSSLTYFKN